MIIQDNIRLGKLIYHFSLFFSVKRSNRLMNILSVEDIEKSYGERKLFAHTSFYMQ